MERGFFMEDSLFGDRKSDTKDVRGPVMASSVSQAANVSNPIG